MTDPDLIHELHEQKPPASPERLSRSERERLIERGFVTLYRWYVARSQKTRNWNADLDFDWKNFGQAHSPEVLKILEGFYAVEQYAPDYTSELLRLLRRSYGRSHFTLRWGSEEEKHADLWRNAVLFAGVRSQEWIEEYTETLRQSTWYLPWPTPLHNLLYTVIQERATQVNYLNLAKIARGQGKWGDERDVDPVLEAVATTIAVDEAAHHNFFLEGARLYLYYFPEETLTALNDVLSRFVMPAAEIVPQYDAFVTSLHEAAVFGPLIYVREVVQQALKNLGVTHIHRIQQGVKMTRMVPDEHGQARNTALFDGVDYDIVEGSVRRLFDRLHVYEDEVGLTAYSTTQFVRHVW